MGILRADRITGLGGADAIKGSVKFTSGGALDIDLDGTSIGTSNFTIEAWVFWFGNGSHQFTGSSSNNFNFYIADDDGDLKFYDGSNTYDLDSSNIKPNSWAHVALVRTGTSTNTTKVYVNGVNTNNVTLNTSFSFDRLLSGINYLDGSRGYGNGYTSNLRFTLDTVYTSAFTPPSHELTILDNTIVLCCQSPGNVLQEATGKKVVVFKHGVNQGDPVASHFTPNSPVGFSTTTDVGSQYGSTFDGFGSFATSTYMVPPGGNTRERNRGRGVLAGGYVHPVLGHNSMMYIEIQTQGNAQDFGDLGTARSYFPAGQTSSSTRGLSSAGWSGSGINTIEFITIANTSNATDFGDTSIARMSGALSNQTRAVHAGTTSPFSNVIDFVTIATTGDAQNFGDLVEPQSLFAGASSSTRGVFGGGRNNTPSSNTEYNTLQYITIASTGNAQDFGDLTRTHYGMSGFSSATRGIFAGGYSNPQGKINSIEFFTIATLGDAIDFGDLSASQGYGGSLTNSILGLITVNSPTNYYNTIDFITISTQGDAKDFGDADPLGSGKGHGSFPSCMSDSHGGTT